MTACSETGCDRDAHTRGLCRKHYQRLLKHERYRHTEQTPLGRANDAPRAPAERDAVWLADLTELRRALPAGTGIGISHAGAVTVALIGERHVFDSIDAALDWATRPAKSA